MILLGTKLILSYNLYVHKEGGFCIVLYPNSTIKMEEVSLKQNEIESLVNSSKINYQNETPKYKDKLEQYFNELIENFEL